MYTKRNHNIPMTCPVCGEDFLGRKGQTFCSETCRHKSNDKRYKLYPMTCQECGEKFFGKQFQKFCSAKCYHASTKKPRVRRADSEAQRMRARLAARDAAYERAFPGQQSGAVRGRVSCGGRVGVFSNIANDMQRKFVG